MSNQGKMELEEWEEKRECFRCTGDIEEGGDYYFCVECLAVPVNRRAAEAEAAESWGNPVEIRSGKRQMYPKQFPEASWRWASINAESFLTLDRHINISGKTCEQPGHWFYRSYDRVTGQLLVQSARRKGVQCNHQPCSCTTYGVRSEIIS